jgi:LacI family transcriptional regulator
MVATIRDVARQSRVSISTASRALNGRLDVSKDVRARVLAVARELNYAANLHARALKGATTKTLGVVLYDTGALSFNAALMKGIYDAATPRGYGVIVCDAGGAAEAELQAHQMLLEKRVDGLLLNSVAGGAGPLRRLMAEGVPFVLANRRPDGLGLDGTCDFARLDYTRGAYLATRHLLELGHCRILYQVGARNHGPTHDRLPGYRQALVEFGAPHSPELVVHCSGLSEVHLRVREAFALLEPRPTAVLAYNDEHAIPLLKALHDLGLRVPEDVAVVGQNDLNYAQYLVPPLTTVAQPVQDVGRRAAEILFQKLRWPDDEPWTPRQDVFEPRLIVRESSGRALPGAPGVPID